MPRFRKGYRRAHAPRPVFAAYNTVPPEGNGFRATMSGDQIIAMPPFTCSVAPVI
jgi:hypothetical protein